MGIGTAIKQWVAKSLNIQQAGPGTGWGGNFWMGSNAQVPSPRFRTPQQQQDAFVSVSHVYSCVSLIAANMAGLPYCLKDAEGNDIEQSPLFDLLERPSETITYPEFIEALVTYLELNGNGYIFIDYGGGRLPQALYVLDSARTRPAVGKTGLIGFVFNQYGFSAFDNSGDTRGMVPIQPEEMIHIKYNRPGNPYFGLGPVEALAPTLDNELSMLDANRASFQNGARPTGVLTTDATLTDSEFQALKIQFEQQYQGVQNFNKPIILQDGLKFQPTTLSPVETALVDQRKFSRDDILSGFGVPAPMLGIIENANYKMDTALRIFWQITMTPKVRRVEAAMTKLAQMFGVARFELEMPDTSDTVAVAAAIGQLKSSGAPITDDEYRSMLGLPPLPDGQGGAIWRPVSQQQVDTTPIDTVGKVETPTPLLDSGKRLTAPATITLPASKALDPTKPIETTAQRKVKAYIEQQAVSVTTAVEGGETNPDNLITGDDDQALANVLAIIYETAGDTAYNNASDELGAAISFDLANPRVKDYYDQILDRAKGMNDTQRTRLKSIIADAIDSGDTGPAALARQIREHYSTITQSSAERIARTETQVAYNSASIAAYGDAGVTMAKLLDGDGDPTCAARNGKVMPLDEAQGIVNSTHPNCKLAVAPVVEVGARHNG